MISRWKMWLLRLGASLFTLVLIAELVARYVLGLGTPPLSIEHPTVEYLLAPNQDVIRFGNRFQTNAWGMRSPAFPRRKLDANELRVMVFGDSVINGGNLTDQTELATSIIQQRLEELLKRPVIVGNISAGSWGPGNWRAYLDEFGLFEADHFVLVISSHDSADYPKFEPLNPNTHPTKAPLLAAQEAVTRYLPRYLPSLIAPVENTSQASDTNLELREKLSLEDLRYVLRRAKEQTPHVTVIQWLDRHEIADAVEEPGYEAIHQVCDEMEADVHSSRHFFAADKVGEQFQDDIHPSAAGQLKLAEVIMAYAFATKIP
jgi:hypothetical protein